MYLSKNSKRQIINVEIVQRFCEVCLGGKIIISTKRNQKKKGKNFSRVNILHFIGVLIKMVLKHIDITIFLINMSSIQKVKKKPSGKKKKRNALHFY